MLRTIEPFMEQDHGAFFRKGYEKLTRGTCKNLVPKSQEVRLGKSEGLSPSHALRNEGVRLYEEGD